MRIGELAERTGLSRRQLRYWSQHGVLGDRRDPNGYRCFTEADVHTAMRVKDMIDAGLNMDQVERLSSCLRYDRGVCTREREAYRHQAERIRRRIAGLRATYDLIEQVLDNAEVLEKPGDAVS